MVGRWAGLKLCGPCGTHSPAVAELVALLLALVGADEQLQIVSVQHVLRDVGAPVAASAPHLVGNTALQGHGVTPQQVYDLNTSGSTRLK